MNFRHVDFITTARSDFRIWLPIFDVLRDSGFFSCRFVITGTHFLKQTGSTAREILDVIPESARLQLPLPDQADHAQQLSSMLSQYMNCLSRGETDVIFLLGDRYELLPILSAAILARKPIAHMFGGESDVSSVIDTQVRNCITKAAHIHFVSHQDYQERLLAMGEEPWRISVSGVYAPNRPVVSQSSDFRRFLIESGVPVKELPLVACCYHPPTLPQDAWKMELPALLTALDAREDFFYVWTGVNSDPDSQELRAFLIKEIDKRGNHIFFDHLGERFIDLLNAAEFMIGNSSSGLLQAPSFQLPVVNVGCRQSGRLHGTGVIDSAAQPDHIVAAIDNALSLERSTISNVFENHLFPSNICRHLQSCLSRPDVLFKRTLGPIPSLERVPEYRI